MFPADSKPIPPSQKVLSSVINHAAWLHLLGAAQQAFDSNNTLNDTTFVNREATRIISVSQFGSGIWLDVPPDADLPYARQRSGAHAVALQRRSGLYLSAARAAYDSLQHAGETPDYLWATSSATVASTTRATTPPTAPGTGRSRPWPSARCS